MVFRMRTSMMCFVVGMFLASVSVPGVAQEFKPYAGSKADEKASREASAAAPGKQSEVYTTSDALDVVREFLGILNAWAGMPLRPAN